MVKHVDKGLDSLQHIGVIERWEYQSPADTYTVYGNLGVNGINHKIFPADHLANLDASKLHAEMILHFTPIASKKGKGFYYQVKEKLESLNEALARYRADDDGWIEIDSDERIHWKADQYEVYDIYKRLTTEGKITPEDMHYANKLWKKYKK